MSGHVLLRSEQMRSEVISGHWHDHTKRYCLKYMGHVGSNVGHGKYFIQSKLKRKNRLTHSNEKVLRAQSHMHDPFDCECTQAHTQRMRSIHPYFQHLWTIKPSGSTRPLVDMAGAPSLCSNLPVFPFPWAFGLQPKLYLQGSRASLFSSINFIFYQKKVPV